MALYGTASLWGTAQNLQDVDTASVLAAGSFTVTTVWKGKDIQRPESY
jgi:hypothetical protein